MENYLYLSPHIRFAGDGRFAYHSLFGNLSRIDRELHHALTTVKDSFTECEAAELFSIETTEVLKQNYFLITSKTEERDLIADWLGERANLLPTGYYVESLQISSSNVCNFSCSYCFADSSDKRSQKRADISAHQPTITFDTAVKGIDQLLKLARFHGRSNIGVKFLGREPLINWRTIDRLLTHYSDAKIQWSITTNGSLITPEIAQRLRAHNVFVVVSVDGPPQTHNALRILKDTTPTYHLAERGIQELGKAQIKFGVSSVVSQVTHFETFLPFMKQMANLGAQEVELTLVMQSNSLQAQNHHQGKGALLDFMLMAHRQGQEDGISVHGDWVDPFNRILTTHKRREESGITRKYPSGCSATSHQISLESSGDLFPCRAMSLHYGHVDNLMSALSTDAYRAVGMRTLCNVPFCRGCNLEGFCQGTCLGSCEESSDDIYQPQNEYCDIYREITDRLFKTLN